MEKNSEDCEKGRPRGKPHVCMPADIIEELRKLGSSGDLAFSRCDEMGITAFGMPIRAYFADVADRLEAAMQAYAESAPDSASRALWCLAKTVIGISRKLDRAFPAVQAKATRGNRKDGDPSGEADSSV